MSHSPIFYLFKSLILHIAFLFYVSLLFRDYYRKCRSCIIRISFQVDHPLLQPAADEVPGVQLRGQLGGVRGPAVQVLRGVPGDWAHLHRGQEARPAHQGESGVRQKNRRFEKKLDEKIRQIFGIKRLSHQLSAKTPIFLIISF